MIQHLHLLLLSLENFFLQIVPGQKAMKPLAFSSLRYSLCLEEDIKSLTTSAPLGGESILSILTSLTPGACEQTVAFKDTNTHEKAYIRLYLIF